MTESKSLVKQKIRNIHIRVPIEKIFKFVLSLFIFAQIARHTDLKLPHNMYTIYSNVASSKQLLSNFNIPTVMDLK